MKELTMTRRLTIITLIFVLMLVIGFLTFSKPEFVYLQTPQETLDELTNEENEISPELITSILEKNDPSYVMIDVRNPYDYIKGYLGEAINIPVSEILTKESISFFEDMQKEAIIVVLYGKDQLEANGPYMFLKQLGFDNVRILLGGYNYFDNLNMADKLVSEQFDYQIEKPIANFAKAFKITSTPTEIVDDDNKPTRQIIPVKRKKKAVTSGGC